MLNLEATSPEAQEALGAQLARAVDGAAVIYLRGELGAGKTTLARGFLHGLGHPGTVRSPTYTLLEPYQIADRSVYHLDLYRLGDPGELDYLGIRDLLEEGAVLLVEWPERGLGGLPLPDLSLHIAYQDQGRGRRINLIAETPRGRDILRGLGNPPMLETNS